MSEPEPIGPIVDRALQVIRARMERQRRKRIVNAVGEFMSGKAGRGKLQKKQKVRQGKLR